MNPPATWTYKIATEPWEFERIHRLNYKTFAEEIPQHARNPEGRLVDKFHAENTYAICLDGDTLAGMVALRGNRPFSLDQKLPNLDELIPPGRRICEIRLLSVEAHYRRGSVFRGLLLLLSDDFIRSGYDLAIISGTLRQLKLYRHLGFEPFGPVVGKGEAQFQPMFLSLEKFLRTSKTLPSITLADHPSTAKQVPAPLNQHAEMLRALARAQVP